MPIDIGQYRRQCLAGKPVQGLALGTGANQPQLVGLAVHGDQGLGDRSQRRNRYRRTADECPGTSFGRNGPHQQRLVVLDLSPRCVDRRCGRGQGGDFDDSFYAGRASPVAHRARIRTPAQQQSEGGHHHRLAGAGFAGDDRQALVELECGGLDDAEVLDPQL